MNETMEQMLSKIRGNPALMKSILQSQDGRKLLQLLSGSNGSGSLQQAMSRAMQGDSSQLASMLGRLEQSPETAAIMSRFDRLMK